MPIVIEGIEEPFESRSFTELMINYKEKLLSEIKKCICQNGRCIFVGECICDKNCGESNFSQKELFKCVNGEWDESKGSCNCTQDFEGVLCDKKKCDCHGNGYCNKFGECICNLGYFGKNCDKIRCKNDCLGK